MSTADRFFDTNVLLYLLSGDSTRAEHAEHALNSGGFVSVQVLNEFSAVASRKLGLTFAEIREFLSAVRAVCTVLPVTEETHDNGLQLAERYQLSIYDAMIVSSALLAGCSELISEDMQNGQVFEGRLKLRNPFG